MVCGSRDARNRRNQQKPENKERHRQKVRRYQMEMKPFYLRGLSKQSGTSVEATRRRLLLKRAGAALVFLVAARQIGTRM